MSHLWLLLLACQGEGDDGSPSDGPVVTDSVPDETGSAAPTSETGTSPSDERGLLEAAGFAVSDGALVFSSMEGCCDPGANCWGNNPSTPYGTYALPPSPGYPARDDALLDDFGAIPAGLSRDFLLRPDEAIVWLGTMPPTARYLGLRTYLGQRPGTNVAIIGSLGASLNQQVIAAQRGVDSVWGEPVAVVTSADAAVEREVIASLVDAGWAPDHIHTDRVPPSVISLGLDPLVNDTLFGIVRVAVYEDPAAGATWEADPGTLWRLTPTTERPLTEPHPEPDLLPRGSGVTEDPWREAAVRLGEAVVARHGPNGYLREIRPYWRETLDCITSGLSCTGDLRDRYSAVTDPFVLPTEDSYLVSFGVNHERTGKATYSSVSVQTIVSQRGIASFTSADMAGSAASYFDDPLADDFYVVVFARTCEGFDAPCIEVPWDCPGGPALEQLKITARAYLEPSTGAAPMPEEMLSDLVYLVIPGAPGDPTGTGNTGATGDTGSSSAL